MDQHEFVAKCYARYAELGLEPGNPDDGEWQDAHYPAPDPEGDITIPLLFDDHQVQGLLQSGEYGRRCFWSGHAKKFLTHGPFVENWFELWDAYDKWIKEMNEKLHEEKNEEGRSVMAVENGKKMNKKLHEEKNEEGKSVHGVKSAKKVHEEKNEEGKSVNAIKSANRLHKEKNEEGKSVHAVKVANNLHKEKNEEGKSVLAVANGNKLHEEKNEEGKSVHGVKSAKKVHEEKNEEGKSVHGVKCAMKTNSQKWLCLETAHVSNPGGLTTYQRARGIDPERRIQLS